MLSNWLNYPKLNYKAIPRILKGIFETGDESTRTWYDKQGNALPDNGADPRNPYVYNEVYDPFGKRYVFWKGTWTEDDPYAGRSINHPLFSLFLNTAAQGGVPKFPAFLGRYAVGLSNGNQPEAVPPTYFHMTDTGDYVKGYDANGNYELAKKGTWDWIVQRWGENPPASVVSQWEQEHAGEFFLVNDPNEAATLDYMQQQVQNYDAPSLVKLGQPPIRPGQKFFMNGQAAIMGTPTAQGNMQYAVTQNGQGDRWKYRIEQDAQGDWVRVYFRTFGAKKEKQMRQEKKKK